MKRFIVAMSVFTLASLAGCSNGDTSGTGGGAGTGGGSAAGGGTSTGGGTGGGTAGGKFSLTAQPTAVTVGQGGVANVTMAITRSGESGAIAFSTAGLPLGVTAVFTPTSTQADSVQLTLTVAATTTVASGSISVIGTGTTGAVTATLPLTITLPADVLLVDDDASDNNNAFANPTASASDTLFRNLLTGASVAYNVYVVPSTSSGPTFDQLKNYKTVIWYTGSGYGSTGNVGSVSGADEIALTNFLDQGNRKVIIFADSYLYGADDTSNWTMTSNTFVGNYLGEQGYLADKLNHQGYTATGAGTMLGLNLSVANDTPVTTFTDPVNPKTGTDVFFTAPIDLENNQVLVTSAIATGRKAVGTAGTSKAILFSFPFENGVDGLTTKAAVFAKALAY